MIMGKDKEELIKMIAEINGQMKESFEEWADILLEADAKEWAYFLDFDKKDLFSTLNIFWRVWSNYAIKKGIFKSSNAENKAKMLVKAIEDCFGINTIKLTEEMLNKKK